MSAEERVEPLGRGVEEVAQTALDLGREHADVLALRQGLEYTAADRAGAEHRGGRTPAVIYD